MQNYTSAIPLCWDVEHMAIATRRIIVVRNKWWVQRIWIGNIRVDRHTIALYLPVTWYGHHSPLLIVILHSPETIWALSRSLSPMETPLTTDILNPLRLATLRRSLKC